MKRIRRNGIYQHKKSKLYKRAYSVSTTGLRCHLSNLKKVNNQFVYAVGEEQFLDSVVINSDYVQVGVFIR